MPARTSWKSALRYISIVVCGLFIAGAALNDGFTSFYFGIPFIFFLFFLLSTTWMRAFLICAAIAIAMVSVSHLKWTSPLVYPEVGSEVVAVKDIPVLIHSDGDKFFGIGCGGCMRGLGEGFIAENSRFTVERIYVSTGEFNVIHHFVLSNETELFRVDVNDTTRDWIARNEDNTLCGYVSWDFCDRPMVGNQYYDPMQPVFRYLTLLMYYPALPLIVPATIHDHWQRFTDGMTSEQRAACDEYANTVLLSEFAPSIEEIRDSCREGGAVIE